jgi:hypothetical protein
MKCRVFSVVYEHRARLEKASEKEKAEHKKTKHGNILLLINY